MRDALFERIKERMDENTYILRADMTCYGLQEIEELYPGTVINVGISEQNMINVAAGLALAGKQVYCYAIAAFLIYRAFDQIRVNLDGMNLPVVLIGDGANKTYGTDGFTHWATYDDVMMMQLTNFRTVTLRDASQVEVLEFDPPLYIRMDRSK